jgi:hypothetical protein
LADSGADELAPSLLAAWDAFLAGAEAAELEQPSQGQEACIRLGLWSEHWSVHDLIASARSVGFGAQPEPGLVLKTHRHASRDEVLGALRRHRDAVSLYFANTDRSPDLAHADSALGRLPLLSVLFGQAYELAVHALDLVECGASTPPEDVLDTGIGALADLLGALAAKADLHSEFAFRAASGTWAVAVDADGWRVNRPTARRLGGTVLEGDAVDLLRAASGRSEGWALLASGHLRGQSLGGLLRLGALTDLPGAPGSHLLKIG